LWIACFPGSLVSNAQEERTPADLGSVKSILLLISGREVPEGLACQGPTRLIMGILIPLLIVGLLGLLLPRHP